MLPFGSIRIGKIFGIEIEINYTWFIIFVLVLINFISVFREVFKLPFSLSIVDGLITTFLFFGSVLFHELSHSLVAAKNKLPIKKVTLFIFGGVAQMTEEPKSSAVEFKMALAGPLSSIFLSLVFASLWALLKFLLKAETFFYGPFQYLAQINLALAFFNLLPGFPLDGGRVLRATLWYLTDDFERATRISSRGGQVLAFLLIFAGLAGVFLGVYGMLWLALIGWFLNQAATASYQQLLLQQALSGVKVSEIMTKDVLTVSPEITLDELVNNYFLRYKFGRFPVTREGELLGVITLHDVKEVPREAWHTTLVKDILRPLPADAVISLEEDAAHALMKMAKTDIGHLLVIEGGQLAGLITRSDIIKLIKVKTELGV